MQWSSSGDLLKYIFPSFSFFHFQEWTATNIHAEVPELT